MNLIQINSVFSFQLKPENIMEAFVKAEKRPKTNRLMINILIDKVMQRLEEIVEKVCVFIIVYYNGAFVLYVFVCVCLPVLLSLCLSVTFEIWRTRQCSTLLLSLTRA